MRNKLLLVQLIIVLSILTGCWSSRELTDITLATTLGIDKIDDEFQVTLQVLNPNEIAGGTNITTQSAISNYSATGKTIFEALRQLTKVTPRKVFLSHLRLVIYGEEVAKEGIGDSLDFLVRDHELRTDFMVIVARGSTAEQLMTIFTPLEKIPANKVISSIEATHDFLGIGKLMYIDNLINTVISKSKQAVVTGAYMKGNMESGSRLENVEKISPDALVYIDHLAVFNSDQLIGWLNEEESKGFNYITDEVKNSLVSVKLKDGLLALEIKKSNTSLKFKDNKGKTEMHIDISSEISVGDVDTNFRIENQSDVKQIEAAVETKIKQLCQLSIDRAKEMKADIFGFGENIKQYNYDKWKEWEDDWTEQFIDLPVKINVSANLENSGVIKKPFFYKIKENRKED
ncbi:Ger(x)C family spore germination protein [Paraliobacillus salinarum]|uniref:Ger(x)C family spore germination protein n=1 Tax=Paraliobacillus salinarum TaxID=1158996 RepID=UPI0015F70409|nr:Ger(x)C family spore germination protein [Paraliobacillus salinarum]